ncbi:MAG TPA: hypothetical protein VL049_19695 [Candidatus Dormibacteraeota bacterium]|nr:hypothetical protein [Candidatus Dormibacteraeota bacterium]
MANELLLKMIVNGLHNVSIDNETLFEHLNLRARYYGKRRLFRPARFTPPVPPYPNEGQSQARAAELMSRVADKMALFVLHLGGTPATPGPLEDREADEADLLRLIIDWGTVQTAAYKSIIQLYGEQPAPPPGLPNPGAASSQRLWAEIAAVLAHIATDSDRVVAVQDLEVTYPPERGSSRAGRASLVAMERDVHRAALNTLHVAALLPYHLFHAAHAGPRPRGRRR